VCVIFSLTIHDEPALEDERIEQGYYRKG